MPAFVGLGAPYWNAEARGALFGLTRGTTNKELAQAALEAVCYQTRDLLEAMQKDWGSAGKTILRVDGGMTASDWTMQRLADILDAPVDRPQVLETTALGAAYLAGLQAGLAAEAGGLRQELEARQALHAEDEGGSARGEICRLERRGAQAAGLGRRALRVPSPRLIARYSRRPACRDRQRETGPAAGE